MLQEAGVLSFSSARVHPMATSHNGQVWAQRRDMATNAHTSGTRNHSDSFTSEHNGSTLTCESIGSCEPSMTAPPHSTEWESPHRGGAATPSEVEAKTDVRIDMGHMDTNRTTMSHRKGTKKNQQRRVHSLIEKRPNKPPGAPNGKEPLSLIPR